MVQIGSRCGPTLRKNQTQEPRPRPCQPIKKPAVGRRAQKGAEEPDFFGSARHEARKQNMRGGLSWGTSTTSQPIQLIVSVFRTRV